MTKHNQPPSQPERFRCPICGVDRNVFRDTQDKLYFVRHQQAGRSTWCKKSGKLAGADRPN